MENRGKLFPLQYGQATLILWVDIWNSFVNWPADVNLAVKW